MEIAVTHHGPYGDEDDGRRPEPPSLSHWTMRVMGLGSERRVRRARSRLWGWLGGRRRGDAGRRSPDGLPPGDGGFIERRRP